MEILAIQRPPRQAIGARDNIKICPCCNAILQYNYEDMWPRIIEGEEHEFITCMSCKQSIAIN